MQPLCGARHGARPLTAPSTVAPDSDCSVNEVLGKVRWFDRSICIDTVFGIPPRTRIGVLGVSFITI
jgi:hypothetical protein